MAREIPELVRAAAGLAATVLDEARKLPETLPGLPVRIIGMAMQHAMKSSSSTPGWSPGATSCSPVCAARTSRAWPPSTTTRTRSPAPTGFRDSAFDRAAGRGPDRRDLITDEASRCRATQAAGHRRDRSTEIAIDELVDAGARPVEETATRRLTTADRPSTARRRRPPSAPPKAAAEKAAAATDPGSRRRPRPTPAAARGRRADRRRRHDRRRAHPRGRGGRRRGHGDRRGRRRAQSPAGRRARRSGRRARTHGHPRPPLRRLPAPDRRRRPPAAPVATASPAAGPAPVDGYDSFSVAQLRGRLRGYALSTVEELVTYEQATRARAPYLTMLRNRLEKLEEQAVESSPLAPRGA